MVGCGGGVARPRCLGVGGLCGRNINNNTINVVLARTRGNGTLLHPPPFVCIYNYYWE